MLETTLFGTLIHVSETTNTTSKIIVDKDAEVELNLIRNTNQQLLIAKSLI
jgi:hypothetical protein